MVLLNKIKQMVLYTQFPPVCVCSANGLAAARVKDTANANCSLFM